MTAASKPEKEWAANLRKDERWQEGRLATVRAGQAEAIAVTGDLSVGGLKIAVYGLEPLVGEALEVEVAFEDDIFRFSGSVQHVSKTDWGSIVGIEFEGTGQTFLARRYLSRQI